MRLPPVRVVVFLSLFLCLLSRQSVAAGCRDFSSQLSNGAYAVADLDGRITSSCNSTVPLIPASILKIPLALAAFAILGKDFRFETEFFQDPGQNLYVRGKGDPMLISEEVSRILDTLVELGVDTINGIYIDNSLAELEGPAPGSRASGNPYDAPVTPTSVNFNTVHILVDEKGAVHSAENQTPDIPLMGELGKALPPGEYRLNICSEGCQPEETASLHTAQLFRGLQKRKHIPGDGKTGPGKVPAGLQPVYVHKSSFTLEDIAGAMFRYSNNFIANQVFLNCGMQRYPGPATWGKAQTAVADSLARQLGQEVAASIVMEEGAGLSRHNRVTAASMIRVLQLFSPSAALLKNRRGARIKSGTLDGVYNYAGYLADGRPFVIILNQEANSRDALLSKIGGL